MPQQSSTKEVQSQTQQALTRSGQRTILVTGASGFLGRRIVSQLCHLDHNVISVGRGLGLEATLPNFTRFDLISEDWPADLLREVDTVIHCAGLAHQFGKNTPDAADYFDLNTRATEKLFDQSVANGVQRFVLVSSAAVYGTCSPTKCEDDACEPTSAYGQSKLSGERSLLTRAQSNDIEVSILRMCTLYGPDDPGNVGRLIRFLRRSWAFTIGSGENSKSLMHVDDAARACVVAATAESKAHHEERVLVYNVAGAPVQVAQLNRAICNALGRRLPICVPVGTMLGLSRLGGLVPGVGGIAKRLQSTVQKLVRDDTINGRRFGEDFGFKPRVEISDGIQEEVQSVIESREKISVKRLFDIGLSLALLAAFSIPIALLALLVKTSSKGPAVYWSNRVGKNNQIFRMAKFRSMRTDAPQVATHLLGDSSNWITPIGKLMRKTSLDELPQLWNILRGDMSFVGPRPALFNQYDLVALRTSFGVDQLVPGVTGWAQINGRDDLLIPEKVAYDFDYASKQSLRFDLRIIVSTFWKTLASDGVRQADDDAGEISKSWTIHQGIAGTLVATPSTLAAAILARHQAQQEGMMLGLCCLRDIDFLESSIPQVAPVIFVADQDEFPANSESASLVILPVENFKNLPQREANQAMATILLQEAKLILAS